MVTSKSMKKLTSVFLTILFFSLLVSVQAPKLSAQDAAAVSFKLVVHAGNATSEMDASRIAKMFLKKNPRWENGERILPVDQVPDSAVRAAFSEAIHKKSVSAIKSYWQRMIFSGRDVPPDELANDAAVLQFVRVNPGGVGYVASSTALGEGVKELKINND